MPITRRRFLNTLLGITGISGLAAVMYPIFSFLVPPKIIEPKVNSVKAGFSSDFPNNSSQIIRFGRKPVILIRSKNGDYQAFDATCTHLDCTVQYKKDTYQIWCACHNGIYDLKGRNISGPPPKPLTEYIVKIINDEIIITPNFG